MQSSQDKKKISVLHILTDKNIGGAGKWIYYLISQSDRELFDYTVILPEGAELEGELKKLSVPIITIAGIAERSFSPVAHRALVRAIKAISPDIVHTHSSFSGRVAARRAGGCRIVMTKHCSDMPPRLYSAPPLRSILRSLQARFADVAIATSESARDALIASGMPTERIRTILNGACALKGGGPERKAETRARLGIPQDAFVFGIFARLEPKKDHETFLRACAIVKERTEGAYFLVVGDGSRRDALTSLADELGLLERMRFCGFCDDVSPYMGICNFNVNTSVGTETTPLAVIEGMSLGVVPIVSDLEGNIMLVGECGVVCRRGDGESFARAMLSLMESPERAEAMSAACAGRYRECFTAKRHAQEVCELYRSIM